MNKKSLEECRACLQKIDEDVSQKLFQAWCTPWAVPGALIADDLAKIADIEISENDRHSKIICSKCYNHLADACLFVINVQKSDSILRKRVLNTLSMCNEVEPETSWPKPILLNKSINGNIDNRIEIEIKQEVLSEEEYGTNEMDIDWEPTMDIKIEPEEIVAPAQTEFQLNGYSLNNEKSNDEAKHQNSSSIGYDEEYLDNPVKQEPESGDEQEIMPDLPLDCMLCLKEFNSVTGLKAHVIAQHSYGTVKRKTDDCPSPVKKDTNNKFVCATCRQCFQTRTDLMVHEACHGKHACFVCDSKFNTFRQLSRHSTRCRPRNAAAASRARPPSRPPQNLSQTRRNSTEEQIGEPVQKQPRNELLLDEIKTEPTEGQLKVNSLTEIKIEPVEIQTNSDLSREETKVELVQRQGMNIVDKKTIKKFLKEAKDENVRAPSNDEGKLEMVEKQSINQFSNNETKTKKGKPVIEKFNNNPTNEGIKGVTFEGQSSNELLNNDTPVEQFQKHSKPSNCDIRVELSVESHVSPQNEIDVEDQLMTPAEDTTTCNSLQNLNINQDESSQSELEMTESTEENSSQSLLSNSVTSSQSQEDSEKIITHVSCPNSQVPNELNHLATQETKSESSFEQELELDDLNKGNSTKIPKKVSNSDPIKEMKIHLAINPLSKKDSVHLETKMDMEDIDCVSEGCEPKLVNVLSKLSDDNGTQ